MYHTFNLLGRDVNTKFTIGQYWNTVLSVNRTETGIMCKPLLFTTPSPHKHNIRSIKGGDGTSLLFFLPILNDNNWGSVNHDKAFFVHETDEKNMKKKS